MKLHDEEGGEVSDLKLSVEGQLRAATIHALDQLEAAILEVTRGRNDIVDVHVRIDDQRSATVAFTVTAPSWAAAEQIGKGILHDAVDKLGFNLEDTPDDKPLAPGIVAREGSRLTLA